jgi:uncharacterized protein YndB with AHSA1/START domain
MPLEGWAMLTYASAVTIARPPVEVFAFLIEPAKQALWSDVPMRRLDEGDPGPGSRMELTLAGGPVKAVIGLRYTRVEPPSVLGWETYSGPIGWHGSYRVEALDGGSSRLSQEGSLEFKGLWRLLEPVVGREIRSAEVKELEKLKALVEATPPTEVGRTASDGVT